MMEPQPPLSPTMLSSAIAPAEFDFQKIGQTILRLRDWNANSKGFDWAIDSERAFSTYQELRVPSEFSPAVLDAWERLIEIVAHLRSPLSGWPPNLPQIPENIAPYVTEEASEVLEALQLELVPRSLGFSPFDLSQDAADRYILVNDLIPKLLWYLAKSSYDVMQLLAGIKARVADARQGWRSGVLRLTAILTLEAAVSWSLDLATHQPPQGHLAPDATIQSDESYFCKQPVTSQILAQQFFQTIQEVSEALRPFLEKRTVDLLEPGNNWQSGSLQLSFNFEFIGDPEGGDGQQDSLSHYNPQNLEPQILKTNEVEKAVPSSQQFLLETQVKLVDPKSIACYYQAVMKEQLIEIIPELQAANQQEVPSLSAPELMPEFNSQWDEIDEALEFATSDLDIKPVNVSLSTLNSEHLVFHLVKLACEVVDAMQTGDDEPSSSLVQLKMTLADLTVKLMWYLIRSTYDIMHLIGGVTAQVLQPGCDWEKGTLRLLGMLQVRDSGLSYAIDVATGQLYPPTGDLLSANAMSISSDSEFCRELIEVGNLTTKIIGELQESSPELELWMAGMEVEVRSLSCLQQPVELDSTEASDRSQTGVDREESQELNSDVLPPNLWQTAVLQLSIGFEFIAEKSRYTYSQ